MRILASILLLLLFLPSYSGEERVTLLPVKVEITARPVDLDWREPTRTQIGQLTYLGGVELVSRAQGFGGFSAMTVEGERFTLLNDMGNYVRFKLDRSWRVSEVSHGALIDGPNSGWSKLDRDSESLARDPATGALWVGFERSNEIWRYDAQFRNGRGVAPRAMADWSINGGAESMVRLRDGSFLLFSESDRGKAKGTRSALWFAGDPVRSPNRNFRFSYRPPRGFRPTDAAELPDGRIILLNRQATLEKGFTSAVTILDRETIRAGAVVSGREVARFEAPVLHDNFEAIVAVQEGDDTILWIASDDNLLSFQRSLLLKFKLND